MEGGVRQLQGGTHLAVLHFEAFEFSGQQRKKWQAEGDLACQQRHATILWRMRAPRFPNLLSLSSARPPTITQSNNHVNCRRSSKARPQRSPSSHEFTKDLAAKTR